MLRPITPVEQEALFNQYMDFSREKFLTHYRRIQAWLQGWGESFDKSVEKEIDFEKIKKPKLTSEMLEEGESFKEKLKGSVVLASALYGIVVFDLLKSKSPIIEQLNTLMEDEVIKEAMHFYFKTVNMEYLGQFQKIIDPIIKESEMDEVRKLLKIAPLNVHFKQENIF